MHSFCNQHDTDLNRCHLPALIQHNHLPSDALRGNCKRPALSEALVEIQVKAFLARVPVLFDGPGFFNNGQLFAVVASVRSGIFIHVAFGSTPGIKVFPLQPKRSSASLTRCGFLSKTADILYFALSGSSSLP